MGYFSDLLSKGADVISYNPFDSWEGVERKIADTGEVTPSDAEELDKDNGGTEELLQIVEYAADSAYEEYTGIVLDPEEQVFKTVSGQFHDKKDFYEKLTKRGYVVRKVFEKRVFDWIEANAKTTLEAYLMFSTAFSKWKGNNLLNPYYVKLLNDIPQLNREKIKGDPNSIGDQKTEESVLDETRENIHVDGIDNWARHNVTIVPEDDELNELEIQRVRFNPSFKANANTFAKLNKPVEYKNSLIKYLQSSPEFIRAIGKETDPVNRDTEFKFYDPKKDIKSPLYTPNTGTNPYNFNIKIDGEYLKNLDGSNFTLTKPVILNWYNSLGIKNYASPEVSAQTPLLHKGMLVKQDKEDALLRNAADFEKSLEILNNAEASEAEISTALGNLVKTNLKVLINDPNYSHFGISQEIHDQAKEFKQDLQTFTKQDLTPEQRKQLFAKYGAENQMEAINNLKQQEREFYKDAANKIAIPDTIDEQIYWLEEYIKGVETGDLSDNFTKSERLTKLYHTLEKLKYRKEHPSKPKVTNKLKTDYDTPTSSPANAPRTGWIKPQGAKAKHTTTQDDLGVNQGIHSFGKESAWGEIVGSLKENDIPKVNDNIYPVKHVNYGASDAEADLPVDGVITSPGASFKTGGTFITEEDDEELEKQWSHMAHSELNQELFEGTHLRPEVREALLRIAGKFQNTLGLGIDPVDVYLTGSSANFNYNEMSDIDLHLVYDFEQIGINAEILVKYFIAKKQVFNNDYDITIKGMPVEVGVENINEPIVSSAIYSIVKDQWMLQPKDAEHLLPKPDMKQYYELVQRIEDAIESRDSKKIGALWDELYDIRKQSLATDGEYGPGNGLFKKLRNLGYLDRLKHAYYSSASDELSLEALKEII
ncbi:MAG: nucleotidyltransferase domain-containing protein [Bacilli bacterium]|nr:nucleotidyltransferase domain-containing protein [Bacilli bacterium]